MRRILEQMATPDLIREIPHAKLIGVFSRGADKARKMGEREKCRWTTDYKELIQDPAVGRPAP